MAVDQCPKCGDVFFEIRYCNNCDGSPVKKLEDALRKIQRRTGAITVHAVGVNVEEIWTIATKALEGK